jgi:hypothetical protein
MADEEKVVHLVQLLMEGKELEADKDSVKVRAALHLAKEHVSKPIADGAKATEHAPAVLLAALAMSAVQELNS